MESLNNIESFPEVTIPPHVIPKNIKNLKSSGVPRSALITGITG